jgi:hypothetical protein
MARWAWKYDECVGCGGVDKPHKGHGLCVACYHAQYKRGRSRDRGRRYSEGDLHQAARAAADESLDLACSFLNRVFQKVGGGVSASYEDGELLMVIGGHRYKERVRD